MAIRDADGTVREIGLEEAIALMLAMNTGRGMPGVPRTLIDEAQNVIRVNAIVTLDAWRRQNRTD